jgi:TRAP-type mannitol/chloroaromatic compound transport system substrate-binding protein
MSVIQTADINIPSDPATIKKIRDACVEISASMTRAEAEKTLQKEAVAALAEETEIPKKYLNKLVKLYHKQNKDQVFAETESTDALYDRVFEQEPV